MQGVEIDIENCDTNTFFKHVTIRTGEDRSRQRLMKDHDSYLAHFVLVHCRVVTDVKLLLEHITKITYHQVQLVEDIPPQVSRHLATFVGPGQAL